MLVRFAYYHSDFALTHYCFSFLFRNLAVPADKYLLKSKESDLYKDNLILIYKYCNIFSPTTVNRCSYKRLKGYVHFLLRQCDNNIIVPMGNILI